MSTSVSPPNDEMPRDVHVAIEHIHSPEFWILTEEGPDNRPNAWIRAASLVTNEDAVDPDPEVEDVIPEPINE